MSIILLLLSVFAAYELRNHKSKRALILYNLATYFCFAGLIFLIGGSVPSFGLGKFFELVVTIVCYVFAASGGSLFFRPQKVDGLIIEGAVFLAGFTVVGFTLTFFVGLL